MYKYKEKESGERGFRQVFYWCFDDWRHKHVTCMHVVRIVNLTSPDRSPLASVSFETSQMPSKVVERFEDRFSATLFMVVNMA